jgi:metal-dependent amidase/aminoacylase/carboxypeptidase family protein
VSDRLRGDGFTVATGIGGTGVAGVLANGSGPVVHMHMACMTGMGTLMAAHRDRWNGTLITLFQPAEETGEGAQEMVDDGLFKRIPVPDVALAQHLLPGIAGTVAACPGPFMSAADSIRVTVYGRGGHGSMPQNTVDPVVLAVGNVDVLRVVASGDSGDRPAAAGSRPRPPR